MIEETGSTLHSVKLSKSPLKSGTFFKKNIDSERDRWVYKNSYSK